MTRSLCILLLVLALITTGNAQPSQVVEIVSTYDNDSRGFLEVPDILGRRGAAGWIWHLILDLESNGLQPPVLAGDSLGFPSNDDILLASGILGDFRYGIDTLATAVQPVTIPLLYHDLHVYVRTFGSDSLRIGVPYTESIYATINDLENMKLVEIPIFPYGYGGIQEFRLMDVGIPSERIDTFVVNQQTDVDLTLSTGERVQYSGLEGNGLHLLRFCRHDQHAARWNLSEPALPFYLTISVDFTGDPEAAYSQSLVIPFTIEEIREVYNIITPDQVAIYQEIPMDDGSTWQMLDTRVENDEGWSAILELSEPLLYGRFVLAKVDLQAIEPGEVELVTDYRLYPVYPNPFNPSCTIKLDLVKPEWTRLEVFDILGRSVDVIHSGYLSGGRHTFIFSGNTVSSGVFFIRVNAGEYTSVQKMVLLR